MIQFYGMKAGKTILGCLAIALLLVGPALAMGSAPPTIEVVNPSVEYITDYGLPGSGERQFYYPHDVKVSQVGDLETGLGNIFVADSGNNRVERLDRDGSFVYQFGSFGSSAGKFNTPVGIAVDFNYRIYVSEKDNDRIQLFDIRGNFLNYITTGEVNFRSLRDPAGMDVDSLGNLYVADSGNDRVLKLDDRGNFLLEVGGYGTGSGFFNRPLAVAADRDRYLFVADSGNNRVQKFDVDGRPVLSFSQTGDSGSLASPQGLAVDDKLVYVSDSGNNRICLFTRQGKFVLVFGKKGSGKGEFNDPTGISLGPKGHLYIADTGNHRIVELAVKY